MLFALSTFALCLLVMVGMYWALVVRPEEVASRSVTTRLQKLNTPRTGTIGVATAAMRLSSVPALEAFLKRHSGLADAIQQMIVEADLKMTVGVFVLLTLVSAGIGWAVGLLLLKLLAAA